MDLADEALRAVPGAALSADQPFRLFDVAIDFCEDAGPLDLAAAGRIAAVFTARGAQAKVSSIHVNAWIGDWDKHAGIEALFAARFAPLASLRGRVAFVGDSANDAPLFAAIDCSVGVANVVPFLQGMPTPPAFITRAEGGAGFAEFADALLKARGAAPEEHAA
jgi:3-deoxy-D-manno-octulosonate 8-phosphate phosphatase KdsC-like HAD superfamily phosphatase